MTKRHLFLLVSLTLVIVFLLAAGWKFVFESHIEGPFAHELASHQERWEFIAAITGLTALAMIVPILVSLKVIAERTRAHRALRTAHAELGTRVEEKTSGLRQAIKALRTEITERKRAEKLIQQNEERFRHLVENIQEVFWMTDPKMSEFLYVSPAYEQIWGRPCETLYQKPVSFREAIHPNDRDRVVAALGNAVAGTYDETYRIERPDGSIRWIRDRAFPVRDEGGHIHCIVGMAEDLTALKPLPDRPAGGGAAGPPGNAGGRHGAHL